MAVGKKLFKILVIVFCLSLIQLFKPTGVKAAQSYYVSSGAGNDTNVGSESSPFKTIAKAVSKVAAGDHVYIMPGTYQENITITKTGTQSAPIYFTGYSADPTSYPVLDGGDPNYANTTTDTPIFNVVSSSWLVFERLKFKNSSQSSVLVRYSHFITFRRNIMDFHSHGILLKGKSSHILAEYNEFYQSYPEGSTWTNLKASKWEGGAFVSYGGAGMNVIRYNSIHHSFNGVLLNKGLDSGSLFMDANTFIYRNRFEDIIDDPYEPETYAFNNHFFENTIINALYIASLAPGSTLGQLTGPVYIYNNYQLLTKDSSGEGITLRRKNAAIKLELTSGANYSNGVFVFNNTSDLSAPNLNSFGVDVKSSTVVNYTQKNNIFRSINNAFSSSALTLVNSIIDYDLSEKPLGYSEPHGWGSMSPLLGSISNEDGRLFSSSPARGKSIGITIPIGFANSQVIAADDDLGAFKYGQNDFRNAPDPMYVAPPGGEDSSFPSNVSWPTDTTGGVNPIYGPKWMASISNFNTSDLEPDGDVDGTDYNTLVSNFGLTGILGWIRSDIIKNGIVDIFDFNKLITNFGQ